MYYDSLDSLVVAVEASINRAVKSMLSHKRGVVQKLGYQILIESLESLRGKLQNDELDRFDGSDALSAHYTKEARAQREKEAKKRWSHIKKQLVPGVQVKFKRDETGATYTLLNQNKGFVYMHHNGDIRADIWTSALKIEVIGNGDVFEYPEPHRELDKGILREIVATRMNRDAPWHALTELLRTCKDRDTIMKLFCHKQFHFAVVIWDAGADPSKYRDNFECQMKRTLGQSLQDFNDFEVQYPKVYVSFDEAWREISKLRVYETHNNQVGLWLWIEPTLLEMLLKEQKLTENIVSSVCRRQELLTLADPKYQEMQKGIRYGGSTPRK